MDSRTTEVVDEVSKWTVGLGMLTLALAPLSLPFLILTAAALLPLLLPLLAVALVAAIVAVPVLLVRRLLRGPSRRARERGSKVETPGAPPLAAGEGVRRPVRVSR